jgi:translocation and assembly module TamB
VSRRVRVLVRIAVRVVVALAILTAACFLAGVVVLRSGWFQEKIRERIITEIEHATGARVEMGVFRFDEEHMTATVSPLVVHGTEPAGEVPLLRADSVTVGLRIISLVERKVDLALLRIERPVVRIAFYPDGSNNVPHPRDRVPWTEDLLRLEVRRYEIVDGVLDYDDLAIPLNLRGERLRLAASYDRRRPRYHGELSARFRVVTRGIPPVEAETSAAFAIVKTGIQIERLHLATRDSHADVSGELTNPRAPRGTLAVKAAMSMKDAVQMFGAPVAPTGSASFDGQMEVAFTRPMEFAMGGRVTGRGLGYSQNGLNVAGADLRADIQLTPDKLAVNDLFAKASGVDVHGSGQLVRWKQLHFDGDIGGVDLREAVRMATGRSIPWNGALAGGFTVDEIVGERSAKVAAALSITAANAGERIEGQINARYDQATGTIQLNDSRLSTAATQIEATGTLGQKLEVRAQSTNLDDFVSALALASADAPKEIPVQLKKGQASFRGTVNGALEDPHASGSLEISNGVFRGHAFDGFSGDVEANRHGMRVDRGTLARGSTVIDGSGEISGGFDNGAVRAQLNFRGAQLAELAKEAGSSFDVRGTAAGTLRLAGTLTQPVAEVAVRIENAAAFGEQADRLNATVRYSAEEIDVTSGDARQGPATATFQGSFHHAAGDWQNGEIRFDVSTPGFRLAQIKTVEKLQPSLSASVNGKASGTARLTRGALVLTGIRGAITAKGVAWDQQPLGDIAATATMSGADLSIRANAQVRDIKMDAEGSWRLEGDDPGSAVLHVSRANVASINSVIMAGGPLEEDVVPFDGFIDGASATVSVALGKPLDFHAELTIPTFQINPRPAQTLRLGAQPTDIVLQNTKPIVIAISSKEARVRTAEFKARDTNLEATGAVSFDAKNTSDLNVHGSVNLVLLQLFNPDLVASGSATVQASIRGSLKDPQLNGRMELKKASLYLGDLPNGVDNANGAVVFDRNRATIEKLTAETGGGQISFTGFLGFGTPLVYRLQAVARTVRVRYPEDVSMTFNSTLALNGTSDSSTVSGVLTLTRASFTPRADMAQVLAQASRPLPTSAAPAEYLRGMVFDVRIESDPNFQLQTSLARNLQAEVDLRLRGTPLRPALLGSVSVNEGEVEVFGNKYTVNRGDIRFLNPVRIDPIFDMNLETKARGVTVNIAIAGTTQKMNVNYSSDPPLQPREIIALLANGRAPTDSAGLAPDAASTSSTSLSEAGGGLISEAISEQLSSRLQRFFGASRVKIDPSVPGIDYLPEARLTVEQQVSKQVTLTYITNLNRTEEQIVQIQWDFSKRWSAIAVRDANGLFGVDFQYRKRLK